MKKLIGFILSVTIVFCCLCVPAFSASTLKLTDAVYPVEIVKGNTFSVYGIVTSDYNITSVEISVFDSDGKTAFTYTGKPGTKTYDIHKVDYLMTFSKLELGSYTYKIVAADSQSSGIVLMSQPFKVVSKATPSALKLSDAVYPESIKLGETFSIDGTVSSDTNITSLTCAVFNESGAMQFTKTVQPNAKSYSLKGVDSYMTFSKLSAGKYTYKVTASDEKSKDVELLSKSFNVITASTTTTLKIESWNYPTTLMAGETFSIYGIIKSDSTITSVTAGVYTTNGTAKFEYTAKPNAKTFDLHTIDEKMTFSKLTEGSYVYIVTASETSGKVVLIQKSFTVKSASFLENGMDRVNWDFYDLSYHNEITSWDNIANSVDGVILRIGYRTTVSHKIVADTDFSEFYKNAAARNLHIGCYIYSAALTVEEAVEEAEFVLSKLKENGCKMDMPIYFDMETEDQVALSQAAATEIARAFCDKIEAAGFMPGIYCNKYFARDEIYASQLSDITFWIAQYASSCTYDGPYGMWQYSEKGTSTGVKNNVDLNYCYYDYPKYIKEKGLNGFKPTPQTNGYTFVQNSGIKVSETDKIVSRVPVGTSLDSFKNKYLTLSSGVTVSVTNTVGGVMATGSVITFKDATKVIASYTVSVIGDVDSNAVINSSDALGVLEHSVSIRNLKGAPKLSADYDDNSMINSADALDILQYSVR